MNALHRLGDVVGDHIQRHGTLQFGNVPLQMDGPGLKNLFHVLFELGHFIQIDGVPLEGHLRRHHMRAVAAAENRDFLGIHDLFLHILFLLANMQQSLYVFSLY